MQITGSRLLTQCGFSQFIYLAFSYGQNSGYKKVRGKIFRYHATTVMSIFFGIHFLHLNLLGFGFRFVNAADLPSCPACGCIIRKLIGGGLLVIDECKDGNKDYAVVLYCTQLVFYFLVCLEHGTKKNSQFPIAFEPMLTYGELLVGLLVG